METREEAIEVLDPQENDAQGLDELDMERLVADLRGVLEVHLDEFPLWNADSILAEAKTKEGLQEELDRAPREELVKPLLRVGAGEGQGHESELEHGIALLVGASRGLDLVQCGLHDASLTPPWESCGDLFSEELEEWHQVDDRLVREALEEVEEDLLVGPVTPAVGEQALEYLPVQALEVLHRLRVAKSKRRHVVDTQLAQLDPAPAKVLKNVGVLGLAQEAWVELCERPDKLHAQQAGS